MTNDSTCRWCPITFGAVKEILMFGVRRRWIDFSVAMMAWRTPNGPNGPNGSTIHFLLAPGLLNLWHCDGLRACVMHSATSAGCQLIQLLEAEVDQSMNQRFNDQSGSQ